MPVVIVAALPPNTTPDDFDMKLYIDANDVDTLYWYAIFYMLVCANKNIFILISSSSLVGVGQRRKESWLYIHLNR